MSGIVLTGIRISAILVIFIFCILAIAEATMIVPTGGARCALQFPKWFGCAIANHENLAGGLIGAVGTLFAGWLAWSAVQMQIADEQKRASADREEVERVLAQDLDWIAEALNSMWKILEEMDTSAGVNNTQKFEAIEHGIEMIAKEGWLRASRKMVESLGWERRRQYEELFDAMKELHDLGLAGVLDTHPIIYTVQSASNLIMSIEPTLSEYFEGRFNRGGKAWTMGYTIEVEAGVADQ